MRDPVMFDIVKYSVIPSFNMSFDAFVLQYGIRYKFSRYPLWEVYLNILIQDCKIPQEAVEEAVKKGTDALIEETKNNLKKILAEYNANKKND